LHPPLGRWSPLAATGLFLVAGLTHERIVYYLAYLSACVILIVFAADIAKSFIDPSSFPSHPAPPMTWPMLAFRVLLTGVVGTTYSVCVWVGVGPWLPFLVWPVILIICFFIAWRNLELWYEQGAEFEEELAEEIQQRAHLSGTTRPQVH
jgi:predicted tellurium resistance membrane protein TerC